MLERDETSIRDIVRLHLAAGARIFSPACRFCGHVMGLILTAAGGPPSVWRCPRCGGTNETLFDKPSAGAP